MKLYKVSAPRCLGYDSYDSMVVLAKDENQARAIHPFSHLLDKVEFITENNRYGDSWVRYDELNDLKVELLANAGLGLGNKPKVILASFTAG